MAVTLESFLPDILPSVSGCSNPLAERAVLLSAIELCNGALVLQTDLSGIAVVAGTASYTITPPEGFDLCEVITAKFNDDELKPLGFIAVDSARDIGAADETASGTPAGYLQYSVTTIKLQPKPIAAGTLYLRVAIAPKKTATSIDDLFDTRHRDAVIDGALGRLYATPKKDFTDVGMAGYHRGRFDAYINRHRNLATLGFSRAPLRVVAQHG